MSYENVENWVKGDLWENITKVNPSELWDFAEEKCLDNEFFAVCTICTQIISETFMKLFNTHEHNGDAMNEALNLYEVEKGLDRLYSDGVLREEDLRRIIKIFAKLTTLVHGSWNMDTPLISRLGHKWYLS